MSLQQRLAVEGLKDEETVARTHSLFDLETDKLLTQNQLKGKLSPEWKASKYKICGSFVDKNLSQPNVESESVPSRLFNKGGLGANGSGPSNSRTTPSLLSASIPSHLIGLREKSPSFIDDNSVARTVTNLDDILKRNDTLLNFPTASPAPTNFLNLNFNNFTAESVQNFANLPLPAVGLNLNKFSSGPIDLELLKRQSLLDFEKALQYQSPISSSSFSSYQNFIPDPNRLQHFLSPHNSLQNFFLNSRSQLSPAMTMNTPAHLSSTNLSNGQPEFSNNFDIGNVREVEEDVENEDGDEEDENSEGSESGRKRRRDTDFDQRSKKRGKWSEYEDSILQNLANSFLGKNEKINFKKIADNLPGRTAKQCREHWLSTLNPDLKKGRWTKAEEIKLLDLMIAHGKSWSIIAKQITGRAEHSVKAKGRLMLGERLKTIPANAVNYENSEAEKQKLLGLHQQLGGEFEEISRQSGFIVSPAKIERTMLTMCNCEYCLQLLDKIKSTNSSNFLQGWTMIKAGEMKEFLLRKGNKYKGNQSATVDEVSHLTVSPVPHQEDSPALSFANHRKQKLEYIGQPGADAVKRLGSFSKLSQYKKPAHDPELSAGSSGLRKISTQQRITAEDIDVQEEEEDDDEEDTPY